MSCHSCLFNISFIFKSNIFLFLGTPNMPPQRRRTSTPLPKKKYTAKHSAAYIEEHYRKIDAHYKKMANPEEVPELVCCPICLTNKKNRAFLPCGHTFCHACANKLQLTEPCYICRQPVADVVHIFIWWCLCSNHFRQKAQNWVTLSFFISSWQTLKWILNIMMNLVSNKAYLVVIRGNWWWLIGYDLISSSLFKIK